MEGRVVRGATTATIDKGTTLACPTCGQRIETALPTVSAICHSNHRAARMRPVENATSTDDANDERAV